MNMGTCVTGGGLLDKAKIQRKKVCSKWQIVNGIKYCKIVTAKGVCKIYLVRILSARGMRVLIHLAFYHHHHQCHSSPFSSISLFVQI